MKFSRAALLFLFVAGAARSQEHVQQHSLRGLGQQNMIMQQQSKNSNGPGRNLLSWKRGKRSGSCLGDAACIELKQSTRISQGSCMGDSSCCQYDGSSIGINACVGDHACFQSRINVPDGACVGDGICSRCAGVTLNAGDCNANLNTPCPCRS